MTQSPCLKVDLGVMSRNRTPQVELIELDDTK